MKKLEDIITGLVRPCLQAPHLMTLHVEPVGKIVIYRLTVSNIDKGRVVGKGGLNVSALKTLILAMAEKRFMTARLLVEETFTPAEKRPVWSLDACQEAIDDTLEAMGYERGVTITRSGGQLVVLAPALLPEIHQETLARWLSVMGVEGNTRFILDEPSAA